MARKCPEGHLSQSEDYCDTCGLAIGSGADSDAAAPDATASDLEPVAASTQQCPNCSAQGPPDALFCEACGYDYTTGTMPRPMEPPSFPLPASLADPDRRMPSEAHVHESVDTNVDTNPAPALEEPWVAEVWIDPDWYADQASSDPMPSPGLPTVVLLRHTSLLVGRASRSRGIAPEIDISGDPGVSRRHAQLTTDGARWFIEDLGSANGTYVAAATGDVPSEPIAGGQKREIASGEQVYVGAWTRIVIRRAAEGEH